MSRIEKKVVAICIAVFMVLSNLTTGSVVAMAEENESYIEALCGEEMIGTVSENEGVIMYSFVPEMSGSYTVKTVGDKDTYGEIYDDSNNLIYSDNDNGDELNYAIDASFEAGNTYYIASKMFSDNETGDITTVINFNEAATASDATETVEAAATETVETATFTDAAESVMGEETVESTDYTYTILNNNTIRLDNYKGSATTVVIPSQIDGKTVTSLGSTFMGNQNVTSVTVPNTVTETQYGTFCGAGKLKTVTFASGSKLETIGMACFSMSGLENITIPNSVKTINSHCFYNCDNLKSIAIPDSVTTLGSNAFAWSDNIANVTIGSGITKLEYMTFFECKSLVLFEMPQSVEIIGANCFECSGLKNIVWNDCLTTISSHAFCHTNITELVLPESVTTIGNGAFANNKSLKKVIIPDKVLNVSVDSFDRCGIEELDLGNSKVIGVEAFYENDFIKSVVIPNSVTDIQYQAFRDCDKLNSISMSKNIERIDGRAFHDTSWYDAQDDGMIYIDNVFYGYKGAMPEKADLIVRGGTKVIGEISLLSQPNVNSVVLPYGVTHINEYAFFECENLKLIYIPSSVVEIIDYSIGYKYVDGSETNDNAVNGISSPYINYKSKITKVDGLTIIGEKGTVAEKYANDHGFLFKEREMPKISVNYRTHVQSFGWQNYVSNGVMSGTSGKAKRLEGINVYVEPIDSNNFVELGIQYTTHCQSYGWLPWSSDGDMNGTEGEAKRLEAIKIQLTGADAKFYDVHYRVHAQSYGWLNWAKNGEAAGTAGYGKRLEGIQIVVVKKGESFNQKMEGITSVRTESYIAKEGSSPIVNSEATNNTKPVIPGADTPNVTYRTHVQSFGWQGWKYNGQMSGTSGLAKRLEGININLTNKPCDGDIVYTTHVQTYGWKDGKPEDTTRASWKKNGEMSGTSGEAKRLEAICIDLTGEMGEKYDIYYRVHAQSYGWLGWAKNGAPAGTAGYGKRLEGIQIVLVKKGDPVPTIYYGGVTSTRFEAYIQK